MMKLVNRLLDSEPVFILTMIVGAGVVAFLLIGLLALPLNYASTLSAIENFKSVKSTVEAARENQYLSPLELAALQHKIVESNAWLRTAKYWNSFPVLSWYYPERITKLEPIE